METLRTIVAGTDFSEGADQALELAVVLASHGGARIVLVHVCELSAERGVPDAQISQALDNELLVACHEALSQAVARYRHRGVDITGVLRSGRAADKLSNVAAETGASMIVIGRHGSGRGPRGDAGSVAERLLRLSSRPILVVPVDAMRALTAVAS
jgi:nucleotide-binding universal stress UspA family protein